MPRPASGVSRGKAVNPNMREAGKKWREMRNAKQLTLEDIEKATERYGEEGTIDYMQLSRIERGTLSRITLDDAVHLGQFYGLSPNQVAEMYGLYHESPESILRPTEIREAEALAKSLPDDLRQRLLQDIADFSALAVARARERVRAAVTSPS